MVDIVAACFLFAVIAVIASWFVLGLWLTLGAAGLFLMLSAALYYGKRILN